MARFRILSLDGGGIRGVISAIFLERLNQRRPGWLDAVDLIAGTSTGGLLALGLANGLEPAALRAFYEEKGKKIFDDSWLDDLLDIGKIAGADYDNRNLRRELQKIFGDTTLGQLKKRVLIATFDLDNDSPDPGKRTWKPKLFHNFPGSDTDRQMLAWKVGMYTSAAPTYFPSVDGFVDGGVYANNPSMCALAQSQDPRAVKPAPAIGEVVLLSLGTGTSLKYIKGRNLDWGYGQWAKPLIEIMLDGVSGIADYQCQQVLGEHYFRLAPTFAPGTSMPMDAVDRIPDMVAFAEAQNLDAPVKWLQNNWI